MNEEVIERIAYCDKLVVGMGGYCGAGQGCIPGLRVWGHCSDGGDVAFRVLMWNEQGDLVGDTLLTAVHDGFYRWAGGLLAQRGDNELITSRKNPGPPWSACDFMINTVGAGGYSLIQYLSYSQRQSLHVRPEATYRVVALASPVERELAPDGQLLTRRCIGEWNWDTALEAELHIYYDARKRRYKCDQVVVGKLDRYDAPAVANVQHFISADLDETGYANVKVTFITDLEAVGRVYFNLDQSTEDSPQPCDPYGMWASELSEVGRVHHIELNPARLWYAREKPKTYCYRVVAWPPRYRYVAEAKGRSKTCSFTIPGG